MKTTTLIVVLGIFLAGISVDGQSAAGGSSRNRQASNRAPAAKTHTYSVKLTSTGTYTDSVYKETFKLTGAWPRLVVKISDVEGMLIEAPDKAPGSVEGVWKYESSALPDKCRGEAPFSGKATAELGGWNSNRDQSMSHVIFHGFSEDVRQPEIPCQNTHFPNLWSKGTLKQVNSDGLEAYSHTVAGAGFGRRGGPGFFFPLDRIRDGKEFAVKGSGTDGNEHYSYKWEFELTFTAGTTLPPTDPPTQQDCSVYQKKRCIDLRKATWDLDAVLKRLNQLRTAEVIARVNEIQKLIDDTTHACVVAVEMQELAQIKRALEDWKGRHSDAEGMIAGSRTAGRAIWQRLYDITEKICKRCCGGIGPVPKDAISNGFTDLPFLNRAESKRALLVFS
jgi:hypothetical protein